MITSTPKHIKWLVAILILGVGLAGCQRFIPKSGVEEAEPPDFIKVTAVGIARPDTQNVQSTFADALAGPLQAEATVPHDSQIADPARRVLMARAEARRNALRTLGQLIVDKPDKNGHLLAESLKESPEKKNALNDLLEAEAKVVFQEKGASSLAMATLDGRRTLAILSKPVAGQAGKVEKLTAEQLESRKRRSYDLALDEVKKKLKNELYQIELSDQKETIGQILDQDTSRKQELDALIFLARPDEVQYTSDGSCQMTLFFDRNLALNLAHRKQHGWLPWRNR